MPIRIEGKDEFTPLLLAPKKGERNYDTTVYNTFQSFADRTIWLKKRIEEITDTFDGGSNVTVGNGAPSNTSGVDGDLYIDKTNGVFYYKAVGVWTVAIDVSTGSGGSSIYSSSGIPSNTLGSNGDLYIDETSKIFYYKASNVWAVSVDVNTGGSSIYSQPGTPSNSLGDSGDLYIDETNRIIYYKSGATWVVSLDATKTSTVYSSSGAPNNSLGVNGDLYIDETNKIFYFKQANTWVVSVDIGAADGSSIYAASGVPLDSFGNNGDLYIDTDTSNYYYKQSGSWILVLDTSTIGSLNTINSISPSAGNFDILVGAGLEITPGIAGLTISLYVTPSASLSNNVGTQEIGTTVTNVGLTWSYNKTETSQSLNQSIGARPNGTRSYNHVTSFTTNRTYTLTITDGTTPVNANTSISFLNRAHWGTSANTSLTSGQIISELANSTLTSTKNRTFTLDGGGEYIYYAYPASFGTASFTFNNLPNTAFTLTVVSHTNSSGHTSNYNVYRSNDPQFGNNILIGVT